MKKEDAEIEENDEGDDDVLPVARALRKLRKLGRLGQQRAHICNRISGSHGLQFLVAPGPKGK
jgi:hypothetical protein